MVYGHSIEEVDMPYFEEVKKNVDLKAKWQFYCYDENKVGRYEDVTKRLCIVNFCYDIVLG